LEYAADRIVVNTVCLGIAKSAQLARRAKDGDLEAHWRELGKRVPGGRLGEPDEFADLVAFLVSERAGYITGSAVNFDGGGSAVLWSERGPGGGRGQVSPGRGGFGNTM